MHLPDNRSQSVTLPSALCVSEGGVNEATLGVPEDEQTLPVFTEPPPLTIPSVKLPNFKATSQPPEQDCAAEG